MTTELYTASRLRVLRQCLRLHYYRYELGLVMPQSDEARFGTVGHAALEAYLRTWQAGELDARLDAALTIVDQLDSEFDRVKLRLLLVAYHERWGAEDWDILAVEVEFRYQLGEHLLGGKIDAIIRQRTDGRVYVLEHKFTGVETSLGGAYWEKLTIDTQVSIYIDGATMLGYEVAGCIYDVLKRPGHEPLRATPPDRREYTKGKGCRRCGGSAGGKDGIVQGRGSYSVVFGAEVKEVPCGECDGTGWKKNKDGVPEAPRLHANQRDSDETVEVFEERLLGVIAESPDSWLQRSVVVRLEHELPAMRNDLVDTIAIAELCTTREAWPRNGDACARFGRMCSMFDLCSGRASIDDEIRFPRGRAHPELATAI